MNKYIQNTYLDCFKFYLKANNTWNIHLKIIENTFYSLIILEISALLEKTCLLPFFCTWFFSSMHNINFIINQELQVNKREFEFIKFLVKVYV